MIDNIDLEIMNILQLDAKVTYQEIGKRLFVSQGTVHARVKKLIEAKIITGSKVTVNYMSVGYDISAYLGVFLDKSSNYRAVLKELKSVNEVISANYTTGTYGILLKIVCKDTEHLREVLTEKIQSIKGIQRTETMLSLEESINRPLTLPLLK